MKYNKLASKETVEKTIAALAKNGINAIFVKNAAEARTKVLEILPKGAEVLTMTSMTLEATGLANHINNSPSYNSARNGLTRLGEEKKEKGKRRLGAAPEWAIGSAHAITQDGVIMIASNTGSQLPAYAYGAEKIIWVVGTQKIVKNIQKGFKRIYEHSLPLESERAKIAYGAPGSAVNKILMINKEIQPHRITLIFVNEILGF